MRAAQGKTPYKYKSRARAGAPTNRTPGFIDPNRCWGLDRKGKLSRCALDIGHYSPALSEKPSPHVDEDGKEWF